MTRPVDTDDLVAAYCGGDIDAVRRLLESFLSSDTQAPITNGQTFVRLAIKEIVENISAGKKPNADQAFRLKRGNSRPVSTSLRNFRIAMEVQELRDTGVKREPAIAEVARKHCLGVEAIRTIYKKGKATAVRDLKREREAGEREAAIRVETFWRDKLSGDQLLIETMLRHERSRRGHGEMFEWHEPSWHDLLVHTVRRHERSLRGRKG